MRLVTGEEMAAIDSRAQRLVPGEFLMEQAGLAAVEKIQEVLGVKGRRFTVLAGPGKNGGDAYVVARHLHCRGGEVRVFGLGELENLGPEVLKMRNLAQAVGLEIREVGKPRPFQTALRTADLLVDGLLGTGAKGPLREPLPMIIGELNDSNRPILSLDLPSGVDPETGQVLDLAVRARWTISFGLAKVGLVLEPGASYVGELCVTPIGFPPSLLGEEVGMQLITPESLRQFLRPRDPQGHKGTYGHLLLVAGSMGMAGAAVIAARGALRSGLGLLTLALPQELIPLLQGSVPEAMARPVQQGMDFGPYQALAIGPGLGSAQDRDLLQSGLPAVIDADALSWLQGELPPGEWVLTPHPGELSRMMGVSIPEIQGDRVGWARRAAQKYQAFVVLKGARTVIASPDSRVWINPTGNPGMGIGGMGDALTGLIGGLLAQGLGAQKSAILGVYLHGLAGDLAAGARSQESLTSSDLLETLGQAWRVLREGDGE